MMRIRTLVVAVRRRVGRVRGQKEGVTGKGTVVAVGSRSIRERRIRRSRRSTSRRSRRGAKHNKDGEKGGAAAVVMVQAQPRGLRSPRRMPLLRARRRTARARLGMT
ncbi:hypothetical protein CLOM_g12811, partial [Closterium sp. NIES-68]